MPVLAEVGACLLEVERHATADALFPDAQYPIVITYTRFLTGFTTYGKLLNSV